MAILQLPKSIVEYYIIIHIFIKFPNNYKYSYKMYFLYNLKIHLTNCPSYIVQLLRLLEANS